MEAQKKHAIKVTVLRTMKITDVFDRPVPEQVSHAPECCARLQEGQTFLIRENGECAGTFPCNWAWNDLYPVITAMQTGGHFVMKKRRGIQYSCCTDGTMPVIFKLEYLPGDDEEPASSPDREGNVRAPLKITVVRTLRPADIYGKVPDDTAPALSSHDLREGQTFLVGQNGRCPEKFPGDAWHDLNPYILSLQLGGDFPGFSKGVFYASSSDGLFPVFFRLERLPSL